MYQPRPLDPIFLMTSYARYLASLLGRPLTEYDVRALQPTDIIICVVAEHNPPFVSWEDSHSSILYVNKTYKSEDRTFLNVNRFDYSYVFGPDSNYSNFEYHYFLSGPPLQGKSGFIEQFKKNIVKGHLFKAHPGIKLDNLTEALTYAESFGSEKKLTVANNCHITIVRMMEYLLKNSMNRAAVPPSQIFLSLAPKRPPSMPTQFDEKGNFVI